MLHSLIPFSFYRRCPTIVAPELIGKLLCRRSREGLCVGRIVETEAYLANDDSAAHSAKGLNRKNGSMFGPPGRAYVYTIHARQCFNIVTQTTGTGSAVLIRAVEPLAGMSHMRQRRGTDRLRDLCRGPARLCDAFDIGRSFDGWNLTGGRRLWIAEDLDSGTHEIVCTPRIGVTSAQQLRLRYIAQDCEYVSGTRRQNRESHDE